MPTTPFKISTEHLVYERIEEGVYPIVQTDWNRIKSIAADIKCPRKGFSIGWSICVGIFPSALFSLITIGKTAPNWVLIILICCVVISFVLAIVFIILDAFEEKRFTSTGNSLVAEMSTIELQFRKPIQD